MSELWRGLLQGLAQLLSGLYDLTGSYGIAIILLTVIIRVLLIPLAVKQAKMMVVTRAQAEKVRKLQPELKRLREKYRDDRQKLYEETKKLQDEHGVNMFGQFAGCLPTLVQMPILFAIYKVLMGCYKGIRPGTVCPPSQRILPVTTALGAAIVDNRVAFLGMELTRSPSAALNAEGVLASVPYYLMVVLMGLTMWYQQKQMSKANPVDPQMAQMQKAMMLMPVMVAFISLSLPSGLTLYWVATNVWTIAQQAVLLKRYASPVAAGAPVGKTVEPARAIASPADASKTPSGETNGHGVKPAAAAKSGGPSGPSGNGAPSRPKGSGARKKKRKKNKR